MSVVVDVTLRPSPLIRWLVVPAGYWRKGSTCRHTMDAGYVAIAKAKGLPLWTKDGALIMKLKREKLAFKP